MIPDQGASISVAANGLSADGMSFGASGRKTRNIRPLQIKDQHQALALCAGYVHTAKIFSRLPFGTVIALLIGQINRNHYFFAVREGQTVGFAGWALASKAEAEAWLSGNQPLSAGDGTSGNIICLNMWIGDGQATNREMVDLIRLKYPEATHIYGRRFYADGRTKPTRLKLAGF